MNIRSVRSALGLLLLMTLIGCDFSPRLSIWDVTVPSSAVSGKGRGNYDWKWSNDRLVVKRPSPLQNIAQISPELVASKFPTDDAVAFDVLPREDWMTDDVYRALQLVLEKPREPVTLLKATIPFGTGRIHTSLDAKGERLAVSADKFRLWNVNSGKIEWEQDAKPECVGLSFDQSGESCYIATTTSITRVSAATGDTLGTWKVPGGLVRFCKARDTDWLVGSNRSGALYLLDRSLKVQAVWTFEKINPEHLAIAPRGDVILTSTSSFPLRLEVRGKEFDSEAIGLQGADSQRLFPLAGDHTDYWMDDHVMFDVARSKSAESLENVWRGGAIPDFKGRFAIVPVTYVRQSLPLRSGKRFWTTIAGEVLQSNGELSVFVQEIDLVTNSFSKRTNLGKIRPKAIALSQDASRVALLFSNELQVIERRPLEDIFGDIFIDTIMSKELDLPMMEKLASYVRNHRLIRSRLYGEQLYGTLVTEVADRILKRRQPSRGQDKKGHQDDSQWLEGDSLFAQSVSFMVNALQIEQYYSQRAGISSSEQGIEGVTRLLQNKKEKLLERDDCPAAVINAYSTVRTQLDGELDELSGYAKRMLEHYPNFSIVHSNIGIHLAGKGGLELRGIAPYFESVANLMPEQEKGTMFAKLYLQYLYRTNNPENYSETRYDGQIFDAIRASWGKFFFHPREVSGFHFFHLTTDQDILVYFYSNYPLLGRVEGSGGSEMIFNLNEYRDQVYKMREGKVRSSFAGNLLD